MSSPLEGLEPRHVWNAFDALRRVPRPSKREEKVAAHARAWAAEHGFEVRADESGNLVVPVPATPGREEAPTVVLQAHLDMVCEKNAGVDHDFDRDPIAVEVDGEWVKARGTTLGADNGIGVAAAMAAAVDPDVVHGPLELLFTLDEETGLNGVMALDPAIVGGTLLLNLDTEEDDALYIGCAGAGGVAVALDVERDDVAPGADLWDLAVHGLRGGHSGVDIHENRGNAIKIAVRALVAALEGGIDFGLVGVDGGSKANAIPRECTARLRLAPEARSAFESLLEEVRRSVEADFGSIDPGVAIELREAAEDPGWQPLCAADRDRLLNMISAAPHGVIAMSREVPGLVETSNNVASVKTSEGVARIEHSFRSSVNAALDATGQALRSLARLAGGNKVTVTRGYPGWKPTPDSPLVRRTAGVYKGLFGDEPAVKAVHAGLECGILAEKVPGLDAVSIGPEIRNPHSPDERVKIPSVAKFYRFLKALLADLAG